MNTSMTLRAEKTNTFRDDVRVLMAGILFCIFMILMQPFVFRAYDYFWAERPFVSATVEIVFVDEGLPPMIKYDADATQPVVGEWIASVHEIDENGNPVRITSRRGNGRYSDQKDDPKLWTWAAWFDNEMDYSTPEVPTVPFKVCVRYDVDARDSGVNDDSPLYCSQVYDPANPTLTVVEAAKEMAQ